MRDYVTKDGDYVTAKGLNLTVEFGERTKAEIMAKVEEVRDENAKLRKLVRDMMGFFEDGDWCTECNHARECGSQEQYEDDCLMRFEFRDRMRELGIEEDE